MSDYSRDMTNESMYRAYQNTTMHSQGTLKAASKGIGRKALRGLAKKGGVMRMTRESEDDFRDAALAFVTEAVRHSITYAEYGRRVTVKLDDVLRALKVMGRQIYGYGV